jgi:8-oxo-dGTP diphosphatase
MSEKRVRNTARAVVHKDGKVLIMERWRRDKAGELLHYYSIPGGGIEPGETGEQAVVREMHEEMNIVVEPIRLIADYEQPDGCHHFYYWCEFVSGEPQLRSDSEEAIAQNSDNRYKPQWIATEQVNAESVHFEYASFARHLAEVIKNNGFMPDGQVS